MPKSHAVHRVPAAQHASQRARRLSEWSGRQAKKARRHLVVLGVLIVALLLAYAYRDQLFGVDTPVRAVAALGLVGLGYLFARDLGRVVLPGLFRRVDPSTAGTLGFLIRLAFLALSVLVALRLAGLKPETLAVGGAITAIVLGLAAQQTLGNLFAGLVLLAARPFRVGERVRLQAGGLAGVTEGEVIGLGLLYVTLANGDDHILVPNQVVLTAAVVPLREPTRVDLRARLRPDVRPSEVQRLLDDGIETPVRGAPHIGLEELDADELVVRIEAAPKEDRDGPKLADEILAAIGTVTVSDTPVVTVPAAGGRDDDRWGPPTGSYRRDQGFDGG